MNPTLDPRLAGEVLRYHTWPHIRQQSVGEHTWQVLRILFKIAPQYITTEYVEFIVLHDVAEIGVGDPPFPVKRNNPQLKHIMDELEDKHLAAMGEKLPVISPQLKCIFKYAELIEMWEWGLEEVMRGNKMAQMVADRCAAAASSMESSDANSPAGNILPDDVVVAGIRYRSWRKWQNGEHNG